MIGWLRTRVRKQPIIMLYFESENELTFYNLEARQYHSHLRLKTVYPNRSSPKSDHYLLIYLFIYLFINSLFSSLNWDAFHEYSEHNIIIISLLGKKNEKSDNLSYLRLY